MSIPRKPLTIGLKYFLLVTTCIGAVLGLTVKVAIIVSKNRAIDEIAASGDGWNYMFAADHTYVADSSDSDPQKIEFGFLSPQEIAENIRRCTAIDSVEELHFVCLTLDSQSLVGIPSNPRVQKISLQGAYGLTDETCSLLVEMFPHVREIDFCGSDIAVGGLAAFSRSKYLRKIDVTELAIPPGDVVKVCESFPALEDLTFEFADLSGKLNRFCRFPHLKKLNVSLCSFSEADLACFLDCTACNEVVVMCVELDRRRLESLVQDKSKLSILHWAWEIK